MTLATASRTRSEQIGDILTALEHLWKMYPKETLENLLFDELQMRMSGMSDDELEENLRVTLKSIMSGGRDRT